LLAIALAETTMPCCASAPAVAVAGGFAAVVVVGVAREHAATMSSATSGMMRGRKDATRCDGVVIPRIYATWVVSVIPRAAA
jgi:hypothetical protein